MKTKSKRREHYNLSELFTKALYEDLKNKHMRYNYSNQIRRLDKIILKDR